jgi:hypothetical protein
MPISALLPMMSYINYALLDAARLEERLDEAKNLNSEFLSLYKGKNREVLAEVAPYLFTVPVNGNFIHWFLEKGWGDACGILLSSHASLEECHRHFRKFLIVKKESGQQLYFRFYDPRVLKTFLPTCTPAQLIEFFGPVSFFLTEGDHKEEALLFRNMNGKLTTDKVKANKIFEHEGG